MRSRFDRQLQQLSQKMTRMGSLCEQAIDEVTEALQKKDKRAAELIIAADADIDNLEKEIERLCLDLLLQQQPVARDLRKISAAMKMITDMERIGDQTADIADIIMASKDGEGDYIPDRLIRMAARVGQMVRRSVEAYVETDLSMAREVLAWDDEVDRFFDEIKDELIGCIRTETNGGGGHIFDLIMITKYLERIGDHATNVAEWVEFSITGVHKDGNTGKR